jgi:hypothetical protein
MAFDDLTDTQRQIIIKLIEELESGNYETEFDIYWAVGSDRVKWLIQLMSKDGEKVNHGIVHGEPEGEWAMFSETDLHALANENYITLLGRGNRTYVASLNPKAHQQYKLLKQPSVASDSPSVEDTTWLNLRRRGGRLSRAEKIAAYKEWMNRDRDKVTCTLEEWLEHKFGFDEAGLLIVPLSTFYGWKNLVEKP